MSKCIVQEGVRVIVAPRDHLIYTIEVNPREKNWWNPNHMAKNQCKLHPMVLSHAHKALLMHDLVYWLLIFQVIENASPLLST